MVPLILLIRLLQGLMLLSVVLRPRPRRQPQPRPRTANAPRPFQLGDVVHVGADARRWRIDELYPPHGMGLHALDGDRFIVLNHTQLTRITRSH